MHRTLARLALLAVCLAPLAAAAQAWPSRPVKVIVPYPPGGNTDIIARAYTQPLAERLGRPVIVENRGGAAGTLGMGIAAKSPNDGYTIAIGDLGSMVIVTFVNPALPYRPQQDFAPISLLATVSVVVTVVPASPLGSMPDLLARARANPGKVTYGTAGIGTINHLAFEQLRAMTGVDMLHVPFKGGAQALTALLGGEIDVLVDGTAFAQVRNGRLKAIAVTGPRAAALPDVPSIGETVPGFGFTNWWGFVAPAGAPAEAVDRLNDELRRIAASPELRERLTGLGINAGASSPRELADLVRTETEKVGRIVREAGIKLE
jgi:tripartite-type tricarboxylate transporter receptor subunit TctC